LVAAILQLPDPNILLPELITLLIAILTSREFITVVFLPGLVNMLLVVAFLTWFERKLLARIQMRVGPLYAGGRIFFGLLQPIADMLKLFFKEVIFPQKADKPLFAGIPLVMVLIAAAPFTVIPFGENWYIANIDVALPFVFAVSSLFPALVLLVAWASNSKYPFLGGLRALFQQVAYEIPLWVSTLGIVLMTGSLSFFDIIRAQERIWFVVPQFVGFMVFLTAGLAELERIPFDLPEAEPELVMGWMTEMSGAVFLLVFTAVYIKMYAVAALTTALFLGGWWGPPFLPQPIWFIIKSLIVASIMVIIRGTFPRVRVDLILRLGWTRLLIAALGNVAITLTLIYLDVPAMWGMT
jgi:NADH-quinone oxidoreductase subunit H